MDWLIIVAWQQGGFPVTERLLNDEAQGERMQIYKRSKIRLGMDRLCTKSFYTSQQFDLPLTHFRMTFVPPFGSFARNKAYGFTRLSVPGNVPPPRYNWLTVKYRYPSVPVATVYLSVYRVCAKK